LSSRCGQSELGLLSTSSTTRPSGQTTGISLTEDEQAAADLYAIGIGSLLQGGAGAMSAQQQAAVYAAGANATNGVVLNLPTSLVNRRTTPADDGECNQPQRSLTGLICSVFE